MMFNTSNHCKSYFIFSIVYYMIILTLVSCFNNANDFVPDFELRRFKLDSYFSTYHFRNPQHISQLKLDPNGIFLSAYNCPYFVLPNPRKNDDYEMYVKNINTRFNNQLPSKLGELKNLYNIIVKDEKKYEPLIEKAYEATKEAYAAVEQLKNPSLEDKKKYEALAETAIENYIRNPMPDIPLSSELDLYNKSGDIKYIIKNYELHVNPTNKAYARSQTVSFHISHIDNLIKNCKPISKEEYDDVKFLYLLLPDRKDSNKDFIVSNIIFKNTLPDLPRYYVFNDFITEELQINVEDPFNTYTMLKSQFVVNNENYMSYLVRMRKYEYNGFHQQFHKCMYSIRADGYYPDLESNYAIMDIHTENFKPEFDEIQELTNCGILI